MSKQLAKIMWCILVVYLGISSLSIQSLAGNPAEEAMGQHVVKAQEEELPLLVTGQVNEIELPGKVNSLYTYKQFRFQAPEAGVYIFRSTGHSVDVKIKLCKDKNMFNSFVSGSTNSSFPWTFSTGKLQKDEVIYVELYNTESTDDISHLYIDQPQMVMVPKINSDTYQITTDKYKFTASPESGYVNFRYKINLEAVSNVKLSDQYSLFISESKDGKAIVKSPSYVLEPSKEVTRSIGVSEPGKHNFIFILQEYETGEALTVFEGIEEENREGSIENHVVHQSEVTEDTIILDMESLYRGQCFYAPTDGSESEKSFDISQTWKIYYLNDLRNGTEYYLDFRDDSGKLIERKTYVTTKATTSVAYNGEITYIGDETSLTVEAEIENYKGSAEAAHLYYSYTDIGGKKRTVSKYQDITGIGIGENGGKNFKISDTDTYCAFIAKEDYPVDVWVTFDDIEYGKETLQIKAPEALISEDDLVFLVEANETGNKGIITIQMYNSTISRNVVLYDKDKDSPQWSNQTKYFLSKGNKEYIEYRKELNWVKMGVEQQYKVYYGGVCREYTFTVGTLPVNFEAVGEVEVDPFKIGREFQVSPLEGEALSGEYFLTMAYQWGESWYNGNLNKTIALNQENGYRAVISTEDFGKELIPDTTYNVKWILEMDKGSYYLSDIMVIYEEIKTPSLKLLCEAKENIYNSKTYEISVPQSNLAGFIGEYDFDYVLYFRKKGEENWQDRTEFTLSQRNDYKKEMTFSELEKKTAYEFIILDLQGKEHYREEFITPEDERRIEVTSLEVSESEAIFSYAITGITKGNMVCYLREKGNQDWERSISRSFNSTGLKGEFTVSRYNGHSLWEGTTYEYALGFNTGSWQDTFEDMEKAIYGEFTTLYPKPEGTYIEADISAGYETIGLTISLEQNEALEDCWIYVAYVKLPEDGNWDNVMEDIRLAATSWHTNKASDKGTIILENLEQNSYYLLNPFMQKKEILDLNNFIQEVADDVYFLDLECMTKVNPYSLKVSVSQNEIKDKSVKVFLKAEGEGNEEEIYVTLFLNDGSEKVFPLYQKDGYETTVEITELQPETTYTIEKADIVVKENSKSIVIEKIILEETFTTKEEVITDENPKLPGEDEGGTEGSEKPGIPEGGSGSDNNGPGEGEGGTEDSEKPGIPEGGSGSDNDGPGEDEGGTEGSEKPGIPEGGSGSDNDGPGEGEGGTEDSEKPGIPEGGSGSDNDGPGEDEGGTEGSEKPGIPEGGSGSDNDEPGDEGGNDTSQEGTQPDESYGNMGDVTPEHIPSDGIIPQGLWIGGIKDCTYNGSNLTHAYAVYDGNKKLVEKKDYTITYKNNKNAYDLLPQDEGFQSGKAPQVIIKGKGNYSGIHIEFFRISKINIGEENQRIIAPDIAITAGKKVNPKPYISYGGKRLSAKDFYVKEVTEGTLPLQPGEYELTLVGKGNFTGERKIGFIITEQEISMEKATVKYERKTAFTGNPIIHPVEVKYKGEILAEGEDYKVSYISNQSVGTSSIIIEGLRNTKREIAFVGSRVVTFEIVGNNMNKIHVTGLLKQGYAYRREEIKPLDMTAEENGGTLVNVTYDNQEIPLKKEKHYKVSYEKNIDKGTAVMILQGIPEAGYTGSKKIKFKIGAASLEEIEKDLVIALVEKNEEINGSASANSTSQNHVTSDFKEFPKDAVRAYQVPYVQGGAKPLVLIKHVNGTVLTEGQDYTLTYRDNKRVGNAVVLIKGKGNYTGTLQQEFSVVINDIAAGGSVSIVANDKAEKFTKNGWKQSFKVVDGSGKALSRKDYNYKEAKYYLRSVPVTEDQSLVGKEITTNTMAKIPAGSIIGIEAELTGNYKGVASGSYRIIKKGYDISKGIFKINNQSYTGREIYIDEEDDIRQATLRVDGRTIYLNLGEHFEVVEGSYVKNVAKGVAKVTVKGVTGSGFGGSKTITFKIVQRSFTDYWKDDIQK